MNLEHHQIRLIANWFEAAKQGHPLILSIPTTDTGDVLRRRMEEIAAANPNLSLQVV